MILYTTHCPKCRVLEAALQAKGVPYEVCEDIKEMQRIGLVSAPALNVLGELLDYSAAMNYVMNLPDADACEGCSLR